MSDLRFEPVSDLRFEPVSDLRFEPVTQYRQSWRSNFGGNELELVSVFDDAERPKASAAGP